RTRWVRAATKMQVATAPPLCRGLFSATWDFPGNNCGNSTNAARRKEPTAQKRCRGYLPVRTIALAPLGDRSAAGVFTSRGGTGEGVTLTNLIPRWRTSKSGRWTAGNHLYRLCIYSPTRRKGCRREARVYVRLFPECRP